MSGLLGKKAGMTSAFDDDGNQLGCTVLEVGPCVVTQVKTEETDGYDAVQIGFGERKAKNTPQALLGHFEAAGVQPKRVLCEFRDLDPGAFSVGDEIRVEDMFSVGDRVDVSGLSKGKGFQGVMKRHGFSGVGMASHGQKDRERAPGSIGQASDPARVFKGMKMPGQTGNSRVTIQNLEVVEVFEDQDVLLVKGSVPGGKGNFVEIREAAKQEA